MPACPVLWLDADPDAVIGAAVEALAQNGVVLFPTDTVYGLLGLAAAEQAYRGIYRIKSRDASMPLQLLAARSAPVAAEAEASLAEHSTEQAGFRAGRITLVVEPGRLPGLPAIVQAIQPGPVGIRVPRHAALQRVLHGLGPPHLLWASSANTSGEPPCTTAEAALAWLRATGTPPQLAVVSQAPCAGGVSALYVLAGRELTRLR
jgi:L-threonylcarbamoyladenylate synthase